MYLRCIYDLEDVVFACEANFLPNLRYDEYFLKIWKKRDSIAKHTLSVNMTDEILKNYTSCETAANLWNKIENFLDKMNRVIACGTELINARTIERKLRNTSLRPLQVVMQLLVQTESQLIIFQKTELKRMMNIIS